MNIQIKNRWSMDVIFECGADSVKLAVELAYKSGADLYGADLYGVNLSGSNLSRADLSGADLSRADLYGANLYGANLSGSDLSGANLSRADLSGANLSRADLSRADLSGAKYSNYGITITPLQILGLYWDVLILDSAIKIGCQTHSIDLWDNFTDVEISEMASNALPFWTKHKDLIITAARLHAAKANNLL